MNISIVGTGPNTQGIYCAIPSKGNMIPIADILNFIRPPCYIEQFEGKYRVVIKGKPPIEECST